MTEQTIEKEIQVNIYCCQCEREVDAELVTGKEIYPHLPALKRLPFWRCSKCRNYVGCHHKTSDRTRPLGVIPTKEIRTARKNIHAVLDPVWQSGKIKRKEIYAMMTEAMGFKYHTANLKNIEECRLAYKAATAIRDSWDNLPV